MRTLKHSLLAAACATAFASQAFAVTINESFDGAWVDPSAIGTNKGLMVDYIPSFNTFFFAFFTYDAEGNPLWLVNNFQPQEGVTAYNDIDALVYEGGAFAAAGNPADTVAGSIDMTIECGGISMDFTPATGSGLAAASFDFVPSLGLDALTSGQCNTAKLATCPTGTTTAGEDCKLPNTITGDLILPAGKKYIVEGRVAVESGGSLTVHPGVTVQGSSNTSVPNFIAVKAGGQIYAEGTREQPITFTGPEAFPGSWAGIIINGRSNCNESNDELGCQFEADTTGDLFYGGDLTDDNSGVLRYVRILWAGQRINPDEELNSLTLNGVGAGTTLEFVQVDGGLDDGFEMFGGTVNGRYLVCSNMGDDCFDFDDGYQGKIQFALGYQGQNPDQGSDSNGFETDNDQNNNDALPRTSPMVANVTMVGNPGGTGEGVRIRRGAGGNYRNMVVTGYSDRCLHLIDAGTFALASGTAQSDALSFDFSLVGNCSAGNFEDDAADPYLVSAFYNAGSGNRTGDPALVAGGFLPTSGSPALSGGQALDDPFFIPTLYIGAFGGPRDNWTQDWTVNLPFTP